MAWTGRCPGCGEWNTLVETAPEPAAPAKARQKGTAAATPLPLRQVEATQVARMRTGINELDRVLGGGIVPGSLVLIGGSPGIGKSTLTGMALGNLQERGLDTLYVSGEESTAQVRLRAERLGGGALDVRALAESSLETILATIEAEKPKVCVIDSIKTMHRADMNGAIGSWKRIVSIAGPRRSSILCTTPASRQ